MVIEKCHEDHRQSLNQGYRGGYSHRQLRLTHSGFRKILIASISILDSDHPDSTGVAHYLEEAQRSELGHQPTTLLQILDFICAEISSSRVHVWILHFEKQGDDDLSFTLLTASGVDSLRKPSPYQGLSRHPCSMFTLGDRPYHRSLFV